MQRTRIQVEKPKKQPRKPNIYIQMQLIYKSDKQSVNKCSLA